MVSLRIVPVLLGAAMVLGVIAPAAAQAPTFSHAFPPGVQVGAKAALTISGGNLKGATAVLVSGTGVQAVITKNTDAASLPVEVSAAPDVLPGMRELRVVTPGGTSNAGRIWVGNYPELNETEPNNTLGQAQKLATLPVTVNGQVNGGEDVDSFSFQAGAGDTLVFDLVAAQMYSALDGYLSLYDSRGKILKSAMEGFERDPRLIYTFKTAGTYTIQVRDTMFRGGPNFTYQLTVGKLPVVTGYQPSSGRRGETVQVSVEGVNLGDMKTVPVTIPMQGDTVTIQPRTPLGPAMNTISLAAEELPELLETEPNDTPAQAMVVPELPVVINGRIDRVGDIDLYRIKPAAAGTLSFDVLARRIGSRIDSFLRVLDATGKELAANDDAEGKDSRIVMGVQANQEYLVEVKSLDEHYGPDAFYRLEIGPPSGQDFELTVTPDAINVGQGSSTVVGVNINRVNGFGGPVDLRVENLPAGVTASAARIAAGAGASVSRRQGKGSGRTVPQAAALFTLTAAPGTPPGSFKEIRIVGTSTIGGQSVQRVAEPIELYTPPLTPDANQKAHRNTLILTATVATAPPYTLDLDQKAITVKRGGTVEIKIKATRQMGQDAAIPITVAGQPANVTPTPQPVPAKGTEVVLKIAVAANAPVGPHTLIITGNLSNNVQAAPALTLTVTE